MSHHERARLRCAAVQGVPRTAVCVCVCVYLSVSSVWWPCEDRASSGNRERDAEALEGRTHLMEILAGGYDGK